eukprot:403371846
MLSILGKSFLVKSKKATYKNLGSLALSLFAYQQYNLRTGISAIQNECQGIYGYLGQDPRAEEECFKGLQMLATKDYDSCGIATIDQQTKELVINKHGEENRFGVDSAQQLMKEAQGKHQSQVGIVHTRWATHGTRNFANAHPHVDQQKRIAVVHNGFLENFQLLKEECLRTKEECKFTSETDTEIIAHLIGICLDDGFSILEALEQTCKKLIGSYNLAVIHVGDPNKIYLVKNSGELGIIRDQQKKQFIVSSDMDGLIEEHPGATIIHAKNNQIVELMLDNQNLLLNFHDFQKSDKDAKVPLKEGIDYYFIQEMNEQPDAILKCLNYGGRLQGNEPGLVKLGGLESNEQQLTRIENLIIAACGTSYYASLYGQYLMREFGCFNTVDVKIASEISEEDLTLLNGGFLAVSQSGETTDLLKPFEIAKEKNLVRFNIVNNVESKLAREAGCGLFLNAGKEQSVASTKAFLCQVVAFSLITNWFAQKVNYKQTKEKRIKLCRELAQLSEKVDQVVKGCQTFSYEVAQQLMPESHVFLLGLGLAECVAKEGSLKMKELTYKHCQAYSLNNCSNGFFSFAKQNPGTCAFFIIVDDEYKENSMRNLTYMFEKLQVRLFVISDLDSEQDREFLNKYSEKQFYVPKSGFLSAMLCIIPIQLAAFQTTLGLGRNPDKPRSLTKVVL